ncbi:MAG TPA: hypothetical protein DHW13_11935 [Lachnospiraceae bacterium]|nr:hypothetical protein [Lachnospiraceae bacterium]HCK48966.1 hypothetical protein [Lachnospiraceae bacterium]
MKRKIILALMTICILSFVSCGKQEATATTESIPNAVESAQVETTETTMETIESTEVAEDNTSEIETEAEAAETDVTNIEEAEPLSEQDLAFSFLGYDTYNEYVEAGNDGVAYILADNANMIVSGEFTDDGNVIESTVRGIKLGDSIDKVIELYGDTKQRSADIKDVFSHDGLKDSGAYNYFLKIDSTKDYFYAFRFRVDQNNNIIAVVIEPISMKYWSED